MFEEVRICGLGSIHEAALELHPGLTVLSGETGAGKTSVVRAFALLAGGRADAGHIRSGQRSAAVEARLALDPGGALAAQVREMGGELEDGVLLVARTVAADGRSRAFVGGRSVPVGQLADLVGSVLAMHGQSSQLQLRGSAAQRAALDRFAGAPVLEPLAAFHAARERWSVARRELAELRAQEAERAREIELLKLGLADVERVAPVAGEDLDLDRELGRLGAADELHRAGELAHEALAGSAEGMGGDDVGALAAISVAARALDAASSSDPELAALGARVHELAILTSELAADLASYASGVEDDPRRLAAAQERRAELSRLCRPHGTGVDGVLRWAADAEERLLTLDAGGERSRALQETEQAAAADMLELAARLTAARTAAARALSRRVTAELAALSMSGARLEVAVQGAAPTIDGLTADDLGTDGGDEVEFRFAAGDGLALQPLSRCASGGELSRVVLALEVVLATGLGPGSMVFDEVDAGIGGEAALEVGRRLAALSRSRQVICVTHLPQVAAFADRHLLVAKSGRGPTVHSAVRVLEHGDRVRELSRMLAGVADSELARGHAAELLASVASGAAREASPSKAGGRRRTPKAAAKPASTGRKAGTGAVAKAS